MNLIYYLFTFIISYNNFFNLADGDICMRVCLSVNVSTVHVIYMGNRLFVFMCLFFQCLIKIFLCFQTNYLFASAG